MRVATQTLKALEESWDEEGLCIPADDYSGLGVKDGALCVPSSWSKVKNLIDHAGRYVRRSRAPALGPGGADVVDGSRIDVVPAAMACANDHFFTDPQMRAQQKRYGGRLFP